MFLLFIILILMFIFIFNRNNAVVFNKEPIKIGLIGPWTGSSAKNGISMKEGAEIAIANINKNGGIEGHQVILVTYDDKGNPDECSKGTRQLIFEEQVTAIIGPFNSANCLEIMDSVNENQVPLITPIAMADEINTRNDYVFRNTLGINEANIKTNYFVDYDNGEYLMLEGMGCDTIGIMWQEDVWGENMANTVISTLDFLGKSDRLIFSEPYKLRQKDYDYVFKKYKDNLPDVIYIIGLADEAIRIVSQGREEGYTGLFYGEGGFNSSDFDKELGKMADGCLFSTQWHPTFSTPMSDVFLKEYMDTYDGKIPDMFSAITYEAAYVLKNAMEKCVYEPSDLKAYRENLRNNLAQTRNFNGISGRISFDYVGQCDRPEFLLQKRWDGRKIDSIIIYPRDYSQGKMNWDFNLSE